MEEAACAELLWQSGFVWDAAAARSLRERHRLVGDAVGCIPGYPQQVSLSGLPLVLSREELAVGRRQGCVRYGCGEPARPPVREQPSAPAPEPVEARCLGSAPEQALPPEPAVPRRAAGWEGFEQPPPAAASTASLRLCEQAALGRAARPEGPRQPHPAAASGRTRDESAGADAADAAGVAAAAAAGGCSSHPLADLSDSGEGGDETRSVSSCSSSSGGLPWLRDARSGQGLRSHPVAVPYGDDDAPPASEVGSDWRAALHDKQPCLLPVTWPSSAAAPVQTPGQTGGASEPASAAPSDRVGVFSDLHSRGYCITGGSKFGAHWLLYPGDPSLYHAQFAVRLAPPDAPLDVVLLAAAQRSSHAARKHMVLAAPCAQPFYLTLAPEAGFGGT